MIFTKRITIEKIEDKEVVVLVWILKANTKLLFYQNENMFILIVYIDCHSIEYLCVK